MALVLSKLENNFYKQESRAMPREDRPGEIWFAHALYVLCQNFVDYSTLYKIVRTALWFILQVLTLRRSDLVHL